MKNKKTHCESINIPENNTPLREITQKIKPFLHRDQIWSHLLHFTKKILSLKQTTKQTPSNHHNNNSQQFKWLIIIV